MNSIPPTIAWTGLYPAPEGANGMKMVVLAPAKLNLSLRIRGRRRDGYHYIESVMHQLDWGDVVTVTHDPSGISTTTLTVDDPELPPGPENLAWKAVEELRGCTDLHGEVQVKLAKRIPVGAGLGGGSADAAAVMTALNSLAQLGLTSGELRNAALKLGADVPFALLGGAALVQGVGERLTPLTSTLQLPVLLVHPSEQLATPAVYAWWDDDHPDAPVGDAAPTQVLEKTRELATAVNAGQSADWSRLLVNDFEEPVCRRVQAVRSALELLRASPGVLGAGITGTGSTIFAVLQGPGPPVALLNVLGDRYRTTLTRFRVSGERREHRWHEP